jgi:hypothetical protein
LTTGTGKAGLLQRVAFVALIAALVCYEEQAPQRPQNLDLVQLLPSANVALPAMATILGGDQALRTLQTARLVYRHFIYNEVGHPREAIPVALATLFESNIGQCDSAARLFAQMRAADGDSRFRQFDLIYVRDQIGDGQSSPTRQLGGHSIAAMEGPTGSIGVDPTFGLLLVSSASRLTAETLQQHDYQLYRLYDATPSQSIIWPGIGISALRMMMNRDSDAAFTGAPLRAVSAAIPLSAELTTIGSIDDSSADIAGQYGAWLDHLGWYYTPGSHVWNFETSDGGDYTFVFRFAPGAPKTLATNEFLPKVRIATTGTAALAAPETPDLISLEGSGLEVRVHAKPGNFGIVVSTDDYGARKIDAIVVQREATPPAPGDAGQEQEKAKAAGPT